MIKLPKPLATEGVWYPNGTDKPGVVGDCYTAEQMLQFRRDALEEAMQVCMKMETAIDGGGHAYYRPADARQCVAAIRELK
jgi:hypothetical protein